MKNHIKVYMRFFDLGINLIVKCENCPKEGQINGGFDIHHINGRIGKDADKIENLMLLCRNCHTDAHYGKISKKTLTEIHLKNLCEK